MLVKLVQAALPRFALVRASSALLFLLALGKIEVIILNSVGNVPYFVMPR